MNRQNTALPVFLEGTYGIGNFGDDLLWGLFRNRLDGLGCTVIVAGDLRRAGPGAGAQAIDVHRTDLRGKARAIARARLVVIGGGWQFNDNSSRTGGAHLAITFALSRLFGRRIFVCGTGFGPLRKPCARRLWRFLVRHSDSAFALREAEGVAEFEALTGRKAILSNDPIFSAFAVEALRLDRLAQARAENPPVAGSPGLVNFRRFRRNVTAETAIFEALSDLGHAVEALSADDRGDLGADELATHGLAPARPYLGVAPFLEEIAAAPFVVTQRFHVLCACALLGVPVVPLVYAEKMRDFCEEVGLPYVTTDDTDPAKIRAATLAALKAGPVDLARLGARVDALDWLEERINSENRRGAR